MTKSRRAARSSQTSAAAPAPGTRLSAGGAFLLNASFVAGLLVISQLPVLDQRPVVSASIAGAALFLLAWSALLFGVLRRGQRWGSKSCCAGSTTCRRASKARSSCIGATTGARSITPRRSLPRSCCLPTASTACSRGRTVAHSRSASARFQSSSASRCSSGSRPIAVFLGMHLLFTDPATSPRANQ